MVSALLIFLCGRDAEGGKDVGGGGVLDGDHQAVGSVLREVAGGEEGEEGEGEVRGGVCGADEVDGHARVVGGRRGAEYVDS